MDLSAETSGDGEIGTGPQGRDVLSGCYRSTEKGQWRQLESPRELKASY